jgi:hypothetical protein
LRFLARFQKDQFQKFATSSRNALTPNAKFRVAKDGKLTEITHLVNFRRERQHPILSLDKSRNNRPINVVLPLVVSCSGIQACMLARALLQQARNTATGKLSQAPTRCSHVLSRTGGYGMQGLAAFKRLNVVVPYRDREAHLNAFVPLLRAYFARDKIDRSIPYRVFIVEQESGLPFNRGALCNIGFVLGRDHSVISQTAILRSASSP